MQISSPPQLLPLTWAQNGAKNVIPTASQIPTSPGAASLNDGFPPLTMTPIATGGIPPSGLDWNGVLNLLSQSAQWSQAGGNYRYNSTFATSVGGYPKGATLLNAAGNGYWRNTVDNNLTNPDSGGVGWSAFAATALTALPQGPRLAVFGDSILGFAYQNVIANLVGGFVVSGGIGTFIANTGLFADSNAIPGNWGVICNLGDAESSSTPANSLNGCCIQVNTRVSASQFTFSATYNGVTLADGDYSSIAGNAWQFFPLSFPMDASYWRAFNTYLAHPFTLVNPAALPGAWSGYILGAVQQALGPSAPPFDQAFVVCGNNDIGAASATSLAAVMAAVTSSLVNTVATVSLLTNAGKLVYLEVPHFRRVFGESTPFPETKAMNQGYVDLRYRLQAIYRNNPNVILLDFQKDSAGGQDTAGNMATGWSSDGSHFNSNGCIMAVQSGASRLLPAANIDLDPAPVTVLDDLTTFANPNALYPNYIENGSMAGTGGALVGATGSAPNAWEIVSNGSSCVASGNNNITPQAAAAWGPMQQALPLVSAPPEFGYEARILSTWTAIGQVTQLLGVFDTTGLAARLAAIAANPSLGVMSNGIPGAWFRFGAVATCLANNPNGLANIELLVIPGGTTNLPTMVANGWQGNLTGGMAALTAGMKHWIRSDEIFLPAASTFSSIQFLIQQNAYQAGTASMSISQAWFREVAKL